METAVQSKILEYRSVLSKKISNDSEFLEAVIHGNQEGLESFFSQLPILEAQVLRSKLNSLAQDYENIATDSYDLFLLENIKGSKNLLKDTYRVIDDYHCLISTLLADVEKNRPRFYDVFFPQKVEEVRNLILQLYPQTMEVGHYKEIFDLCGYAPFEGNDNITQLTMKRLQTYLSYKVVTKDVEVFDNYTLAELSGLIREDRIKSLIHDFWDKGRLDNLQFIAHEYGGRLLLDSNKVKVFEVGTPDTASDGEPIFGLVFATPSFYSYNPIHLLNKQKGSYFFLDQTPRMATSIVEIDVTLLRQDFLKPPMDNDSMKFKIKVQVPINLFKFAVKKM